MKRTFLKSKLHRATVTEANLEYEGSITIDTNLLEQADILTYERVEVYNIANGARIATYAIPGPAGSGVICANGAAAHLIRKGDKVIICTYCELTQEETAFFKPKVLLLGDDNQVKSASY